MLPGASLPPSRGVCRYGELDTEEHPHAYLEYLRKINKMRKKKTWLSLLIGDLVGELGRFWMNAEYPALGVLGTLWSLPADILNDEWAHHVLWVRRVGWMTSTVRFGGVRTVKIVEDHKTTRRIRWIKERDLSHDFEYTLSEAMVLDPTKPKEKWKIPHLIEDDRKPEPMGIWEPEGVRAAFPPDEDLSEPITFVRMYHITVPLRDYQVVENRDPTHLAQLKAMVKKRKEME